MATGPKKIRIEDDLWTAFGELTPEPENRGYRDGRTGGRTGILREFIRWYNGEPGAKCPRRPRSSVHRAAAAEADPR